MSRGMILWSQGAIDRTRVVWSPSRYLKFQGDRWFFLFGFEKSERGNIDARGLASLKAAFAALQIPARYGRAVAVRPKFP